ncbi:MAG: hypothetical protein ACN4GZ_06430 [Acidimicrobiales bacterium]
MLIWWVVAVVTVACVAVVIFAVRAARQTARHRRSLRHLARPLEPASAYRAVVNARSAFTRSVQAYEEALAQAGSVGSAGGSSVPSDSQTQAVDLEMMETRKDHRRTRLLEAQRAWEEMRPAEGADSPVNMWVGAGELWGWSLGLVGYETTLLRLEHAVDSSCWVVVETRRFRLGPALGAERLRLGMVVEGPDSDQLTGLIQVAMGGPEIALRPGTSIARWLAGQRLSGRSLFDALRGSVDSSSRVYLTGLGPSVNRLSLGYLSEVRDIDLDRTDAGLGGAFDELSVRISSSGPSVLAGVWFGRRPSARVVAGSNHQAWVRS